MDEIELLLNIQRRFENTRTSLEAISHEIGYDLLVSPHHKQRRFDQNDASNLGKEVKILKSTSNFSDLRYSPIILTKKLGKKYAISVNSSADTSTMQLSEFSNIPIYEALLKLSPNLAKSYAQIKIDLKSTERISWGGTAHEIRQIIVTMLDMLAPDKEVESQPNYRQEKDAKRPTQKQKVVYILQKKKAGSAQQEVVEKVTKLEETIAEVVRSFYGRASDAAHRLKDKRETRNLLNYFEAFAHDLLDIE